MFVELKILFPIPNFRFFCAAAAPAGGGRLRRLCFGLKYYHHFCRAAAPVQVEPGQSVDYAWDEPGRTRKLRCELDGAHGAALREPATHTYTLDEIKVAGPAHCSATTLICKIHRWQSCISSS